MKKILTILLISNLISWTSVSQKFPLDQNGEISYQEIVEVDSLEKKTGFLNGSTWLNSLKEQILITKIDSIEGNLTAHSSFFVYSQSGVFKKLSGKITYSIALDFKDGKYRYSFSDFVFHYYKQDRTYKMVETGKTKRLKEPDAQGWQKLWTNHRIAVSREMKKNIELLKIRMKEHPIISREKVSAKKTEW